MPTTPTPTAATERPLQFDHAESGDAKPSTPTCSVCKAEIRDAYFSAGGEVFCRKCRTDIIVRQTGGSGSKRFARSLGLGVLAAAVGAALYYAVLAITGYEIGLIAIIVGFLVGAAVRKGSQGRGGWVYQTLAIALTYSAIVVTYIPFIVKEFRGPTASASVVDSLVTTQAKVATRSDSVAPSGGQGQGAGNRKPAPGRAADINPVVALVVGFALLFLLAAAAPILAGFSNVIGILIIGFALFEAWKLNKRVRLTFTGPHRVGAAQPAGA
jgi:hypothetical protein